MHKISKSLFFGLIALFILLVGILVGTKLVKENQNINEGAAPASGISISPANQDVAQSNNFEFLVKLNSDLNLLTGIDIRLKYDKDAIEITSLEKGSSLTDFTSVITSTYDNTKGEITFVAFTLDKSKAVKGNDLSLLKVSAKAKSDAQKSVYTIQFGDETTASGVGETENIITNYNSGTVTIVDPSQIGGTYQEGEPNSCGGTCGSNNNCKSNLYCYEGFCRNPICPLDKNCGCTATATATTKPTVKPVTNVTKSKTPTPTSTPIKSGQATQTKGGLNGQVVKPIPTYVSGIALIDKTDNLDFDRNDDYTEPQPQNNFLVKYAMFIVSALALFVIGVIIYVIKKKRDAKIPHILPPTNI